VIDEVLARLAALVGVALACEDKRLLDQVAVDWRAGLPRVLFDDREQVTQELALLVG
jgi:hypothetical protein